MYRVRTVAQQLPCASGTYATQRAGTRSLYVQHRGSGTYGSAQRQNVQAEERRVGTLDDAHRRRRHARPSAGEHECLTAAREQERLTDAPGHRVRGRVGADLSSERCVGSLRTVAFVLNLALMLIVLMANGMTKHP